MAKKAGRGTTKSIFFKNRETNFIVPWALTGVSDDGASSGNLNSKRVIIAKDKGDFIIV